MRAMGMRPALSTARADEALVLVAAVEDWTGRAESGRTDGDHPGGLMLRVVVGWCYEACCEYSDENARQSDGGNEDCAAGAGIVDEEAFWVCAYSLDIS